MPLDTADLQQIDRSTAPVEESIPDSALPKITVITPSFNQAKYLQATIDSVLSQNYPNLEWLVVDGGSKDGSVDLIKKYEQHFTWWVSEKDRNHPHALNKGFERATGEVTCFVNSDDLLEPGALRYVGKTFLKPDVNWVVGWAKYFDNAGDEWVYAPQRADRPIDFFLHNPIPQISTFFRTEALKKVGPFTEKYLWSFDYEYWMRLYFKAGWRPTFVRRCLGQFRLHMESKTVSKPGNYGPDNQKLHEEYMHYLSPKEQKQFRREKKDLDAHRAGLAAWTALKTKDIAAARKHAWASVSNRFTNPASWRVMYCALRGH